MWELDHKEGWVQKNWCFWTVVLEKTLESPLGCKEIQPVHPKGNQSWIFIGKTNVETEVPISGYLVRRANSLEKTLMLGKIEGGRRRGRQRLRWLDGITDLMDKSLSSGSWWRTGKPGVLQSMGSQRVDRTERLNNNNTNASQLCLELTPIPAPRHFPRAAVINPDPGPMN